jgi:hypothetical protein
MKLTRPLAALAAQRVMPGPSKIGDIAQAALVLVQSEHKTSRAQDIR